MAIQIGEMFMLGFRGSRVPDSLREFAREFGLGGVILFDYDCLDKKYERNVFSPTQVKELCAEIHALPSHPLVYVDQEGGKVRRLKEKYGFAPLASAKNFAKLDRQDRQKQLATAFAELKEIGIDYNLAPVVDLDLNPKNPDLGAVERCFAPDVETVMSCAEDFIAASRASSVGLCLKHFPGCGAAQVNSHLELMDLSDCVSNEQIGMFKSLVNEVPMVLFSHGLVRQWDSQWPTSLSPVAVQKLRAWNPNAVIVTDDLQMEGMQRLMTTGLACTQAVRAGIDLLCIGNNMIDEQKDCAGFAQEILKACEADRQMQTNAVTSITRLQGLKRL